MKSVFSFQKNKQNSKPSISLITHDGQKVILSPPNKNISDQLTLIDMNEEDLKIAQLLKPLMEENMKEMIDLFYEKVLQLKWLEEIIEKHSSTDRLKKTLRLHINEMFSGIMDEEFFRKREIVASIHYRIGLTPKYYMGSFQSLYKSMMELLEKNIPDFEQRQKAIATVTKLLNLEQQLVLEAYEKENLKQRELEHEQVKNNLKEKILEVTEDLAALSQETSASVDQLITSSSEVSNTVVQSSDKTRLTQQVATESQQRMEELSNKMQELKESSKTMDDLTTKLTESSNEIERVIGIVKSIADQTNLLALNSAIEAARAGEHGRGFAVVADEVRKLSEETKQSVGTIESLVQKSASYIIKVNEAIEEVNQLVGMGSDETDETKESFQDIANSLNESIDTVLKVEEEFKNLAGIINEIGKASNQVALSAEQLNETAKDA